MFARLICVAILAGALSSGGAAAEPLPCSTENLLAHKALVENASVRLDDCNRRVVAEKQWSHCEVSAEIPERMPWIRECLSERLAANIEQLDSLTDARASEISTLNTEAHRLAEMGDVFSFYSALTRTNMRFQLESLKRSSPNGM